MLRRVWMLALAALLTGCSGGQMLEQNQIAPALSTHADGSVEGIDGRTLNLGQLSRRGPVVLVFLRGFS